MMIWDLGPLFSTAEWPHPERSAVERPAIGRESEPIPHDPDARDTAPMRLDLAHKNENRPAHEGLTDLVTRCGTLSRDGRIRTGDPLNPIQVRYRAAPRPEERKS